MTEKEKQLKKERETKRAIILLVILFLLGKKSKLVAQSEISIAILIFANQLPKSVKRNDVVNALSLWAAEYLLKAGNVRRREMELGAFLERFADSEPVVRHVSDNDFIGSELIGKPEERAEVTESTLFAEIERQIELDEKRREFKEALEEETDLYVISTHANSSLRCFPDQGKIVSKSLPAVDGEFRTGTKTKGGYEVYSLQAMLARVDEKGYHNFIICGFNCKHHLKPFFDEGQKPEIELEEAERNQNLIQKRKMEWQLRKYADAYAVYIKPDREKAVKIKRNFDALFSKYAEFCKEKGLKVELWRCK